MRPTGQKVGLPGRENQAGRRVSSRAAECVDRLPAGGTDPAQLLIAAGIAMYQAPAGVVTMASRAGGPAAGLMVVICGFSGSSATRTEARTARRENLCWPD